MNLNYGDAHTKLVPSPLFRNQEDRNSYTQVMRGRPVIRNNGMWTNQRTKQKPGARLAGTPGSTSSGSSLPEATWIHALLLSFHVPSSGCKCLFEAAASSCHQGRFPPRRACLDPQTLLNVEEQVSFQNEGQRPQTRPQVMHMVKNAKELQHPEEQFSGPQTWYPLETSISSLVKRKKRDLERVQLLASIITINCIL